MLQNDLIKTMKRCSSGNKQTMKVQVALKSLHFAYQWIIDRKLCWCSGHTSFRLHQTTQVRVSRIMVINI